MMHLWEGLGEWASDDNDDNDQKGSVVHQWLMRCPMLQVFLYQFDDGRWLANLETDEVDEENWLDVKDFEGAKKETMAWVRDILRCGFDKVTERPDEIRFVQITQQYPYLIGLTASGVVYRIENSGIADPSWQWTRMNMRRDDL